MNVTSASASKARPTRREVGIARIHEGGGRIEGDGQMLVYAAKRIAGRRRHRPGVLCSTLAVAAGHDPQIAEDEARYFFQRTVLDEYDDIGVEAHRVADEIVRWMNGVARLLEGGYRPVWIVGR